MEYLFETERMRMRRFEADDARCLYENHLDGEVRRWIPNESYADMEEARQAIGFYAECVNRNELPFVLAVTLRDTGELIGDAGINPVAGKPGEVEVGFVIYRAYRGKGCATELLRGMTNYALANLHPSALFGRVMRGNDASERVLQKNGYRFISEEFGAEDDPRGDGMLVYAANR